LFAYFIEVNVELYKGFEIPNDEKEKLKCEMLWNLLRVEMWGGIVLHLSCMVEW